MKKAYVIPDLTVVEIRCGNLLSVSAESVLIHFDDTGVDIPAMPDLDIYFGGTDLDGYFDPM